MKRKTWRTGFSVSSPVTLSRQRTRSSCFSRLPYRATISVWVNASILSIARMRSIRYCDMLSARLVAHQHPDFFGKATQEDRGLAGRVAAPDQNDLLVPA